MVRFSVCGGDDREGPSNNQLSRKRQRLPSINEDEENAENSDAGSSDGLYVVNSDEENAENSDTGNSDEQIEEEFEESDERGSTSDDESIGIIARGSTGDDCDREVVIEERQFGKFANSQIISSSSKDSSLFVTLVDPDVLDCPICYEPLKIPIFQCDNGHLACSLCCTKVKNRCPSCTLPIGYSRCRAMEKVIEASRISCPNAKYGCKENTSYGKRSSHEKLCVFTPCTCPILICNYTGYYKDLNRHVRDEHKDDLIPFVWNTRLTISLDRYEKTKILQEENDGHVIVVQVFRALHLRCRDMCVSVSCIAPSAPGVGKFSCTLAKTTVDNLLKQRFMMKNIQKVNNEKPAVGFMLIPSYLLSGNENLNLQILIGQGHTHVTIHS